MISSRPPSDEEIREAFESFLQNPSAGVVSDAGFDSKTESAMIAVAIDPNPASIARARVELQRQIDGTHQREEDAKMEAILKELSDEKRS